MGCLLVSTSPGPFWPHAVPYTLGIGYILAELNCRVQPRLDISATAEREMKRQKSWEVILKMVLSGQGVRAFCFASLCLTVFICDVGITVALWAHRKLQEPRSYYCSPSNAVSSQVPVAPWWGRCSECSVFELVFGHLSPPHILPFFSSPTNFITLPDHKTLQSGIY